MSKKRLSTEDALTIDRKRSKIVSIEPTILSDIDNNNNLYRNLFLYEALHDFSKSRGTEEGLAPIDIRNNIGLYTKLEKIPVANDEDRFIEYIDSGRLFTNDGNEIDDLTLSYNNTFTNSINYYNQYINGSSIDNELETILIDNDIVEVYFDYYKENKGKWLDLKTVNTLKTLIGYLYSTSADDNKLRFLVDTCKLNLAMVYYNTPYSSNDNIYQIVDETNKWDMASTRKNKSQIQSTCLSNSKVKLEHSITMSIPISSSKSKKEYRKIAYNLLSENLLEPINIGLKFPTDNLGLGLEYVYITIDSNRLERFKNSFVIVPTITSGIEIMIGNIVYSQDTYKHSECYSTTIIKNDNKAILLVNTYAYGKGNDILITDEEDVDNAKGVFSVNMIKTLLTKESKSDIYKNLSSIHGNDLNKYRSLLFDIKRSGDWSQILTVYKNKNKMNNVFITIDRMAFQYAKLLKVPAILTSKDYGSDTYRFMMYRDKTFIMSEEDRKALEQKRYADLQIQIEMKIAEGIINEYNEKYDLVRSIYNRLKDRGFKNNIDSIKISNSTQFTNKNYINEFIFTIWQTYKIYIGSKIESINTIVKNSNLTNRLDNSSQLEKISSEIRKLNSILESYNSNFNIQKYLDTSLPLPSTIFNPIKNDNNKIQWLLKTVKECLICPAINEYMGSILENISTLFISTTKRSFKINDENIIHIISAVNGLTTIAGYGSLVNILTRVNFNEIQLKNWFENTNNLLKMPKNPEKEPKTKIVSKPIHRNRATRLHRGGYYIDETDSTINYKYYLPGKINKKTVTSKDINDLYQVLLEYIGYVANDNSKENIVFNSGMIEYKKNSKYINQHSLEYIKNLFKPTYIKIVKLYIKYSASILGLAVEDINTELELESDSTIVANIKYIYNYFNSYSPKIIDKIDNNSKDINVNSIPNINDTNNYLDEIENTETLDSDYLIMLPIDNIYKQLEIDINKKELETNIKVIYYYLISLAINELSINNNTNDTSYIENTADFAVEPANQYYKDLDNLIEMFKEIQAKTIIVGGSTDIEQQLEYKDYFREAVSHKSSIRTKLDLLNITRQYINEFSLGINNLNNYYIELLLHSNDSITCETYMGMAATLKSTYHNIYSIFILYIEGYYNEIECIEKIKIQTSRLSIYHDSTLATLDNDQIPFIELKE